MKTLKERVIEIIKEHLEDTDSAPDPEVLAEEIFDEIREKFN